MKCKLFAFCAALPLFAHADTQAILVGGGYKLESSQGQIEENVRWLQQVLPNHVNSLDIFFGSGTNEKTHDVVYWDNTARSSEQRNSLADVLDSPSSEWMRYKHNQVNPNFGSTEKSNLESKLGTYLPQLKSNNFLFVYNGHGGYGGLGKTHLNNFLLWNNTQLNTDEFRNLLDKIPPKTTSRFVLTQCYSGGFYNAVINNNKVIPHRCGFMADAENLEAEGCELGINKDDFRDYTTYFFAALNGKTRHNEALMFNPDKDGNQKISFREAHFYALEAALSSDLSRSTSEIFLEKWQPWHIRWQTDRSAQNDYDTLAKAVAIRNSIQPDKLNQQRSTKELELADIQSKKQATTEKIKSLQKTLLAHLELDFPFLKHPYTSSYTSAINQQTELIQQKIRQLGEYPQLVNELNLMEQLLTQELAKKREITQIEKVRRLQRLAILENAFDRFASSEQKRGYQSLVDCEKGHLN
ncbi:MAG: hypothetical protein IPK77_06290 [Cellvibrio sp.]|nr:hypothetical protein [Cellvibrio sp.]